MCFLTCCTYACSLFRYSLEDILSCSVKKTRLEITEKNSFGIIYRESDKDIFEEERKSLSVAIINAKTNVRFFLRLLLRNFTEHDFTFLREQFLSFLTFFLLHVSHCDDCQGICNSRKFTLRISNFFQFVESISFYLDLTNYYIDNNMVFDTWSHDFVLLRLINSLHLKSSH